MDGDKNGEETVDADKQEHRKDEINCRKRKYGKGVLDGDKETGI